MRTAVNTVGKGDIVLQVLLGYYSSGAVSIMGDQSNILCRVRSPYVPKRHDWDAQVKLCSLRPFFDQAVPLIWTEQVISHLFRQSQSGLLTESSRAMMCAVDY